MCAFSIHAANGTHIVKIGDLYYKLYERGYYYTNHAAVIHPQSNEGYPLSNEKYSGDIVIPTSVSYFADETFPVTEISTGAFSYNTEITSVTIPNSVHTLEGKFYDDGSGGATFRGCTGLTSVIMGDSVTAIGEAVFEGCTSLTSITLPNSITSIGEKAFKDCSSLTSITIPDSITSIENETFANCTSLTSITIPNSVTSIGWSAFADCTSLTSITIPNNVTSIGYGAFENCTGLTSVTIGSSVTSFTDHNGYNIGAFYGCTGLTSIVVESSNTKYDSRDNCNAIIETSTNTLVVGCKTTIIPNSVTSIGGGAFVGSGLTSITIPNSITIIEDYAFSDCTSLTDVTVGNNVVYSGETPFAGCTGLTSVVWNVNHKASSTYACHPFCSVTMYGDVITTTPSIASFTIGDDVESIPDYLCSGMSNLTSITIPEGVTSIGQYAFGSCTNLTSVVWNAKQCKLSEYEYGGYSPFYSYKDSIASITSFTFGNEVESIPSWLCYNMNKLTSITIPNSVTSIGDWAFAYCTGLTSITIGNSVTSIDWGAFAGCTGLESISVLAETPPSIESSTFEGIFWDASVYIPCGTLEAYLSAAYWTEHFINYIEKWLYSLTLTTQDNTKGSVRVIKEATSCTDNTAVCEATANEHCHFTRWNDGNTDNPRTLVLKQNTSLVAEFAIDRHTITVSAGEHGNVSGAGTYDYGTTATLRATADEHYHFTQWSDGNTDNPRTVSVEGDATYTAEFAIDQHTITTNAHNGTITGGGTYDYGTTATLTATADEHYHFTQWSDGNTDNPRKITIEGDATYTAEFAIDQHTITATCDPQQGMITGAGTYDYGAQVTLTATANKGYEFAQWSNGVTDNPYLLTATEDLTLEAQFVPATAVENISTDGDTAVRKVFRDGQVLILRNGNTYTTTGVEVK